LLICASIESVSAAAKDLKINAYTPDNEDQDITDYAAFELVKKNGKMAMHVFADTQKLKELCRGVRDNVADPRPKKAKLRKRLRDHRSDVKDYVDSQDNIQSELGDAIEDLKEFIDSKLKKMKKKIKAAKALGASSNSDFDPWRRKDRCLQGKDGDKKKRNGKRNARKKNPVRHIQTQTSFSSESEEEEDSDPLQAWLDDAEDAMSGKKRKTGKKKPAQHSQTQTTSGNKRKTGKKTSHVLLKTVKKKHKKKNKHGKKK